ncbi:MAG TPA: aminoglycoside 6'-N-acetyltransferase [Candidatus Saccharimonadales bacterium]|nr:aminoglycoside 6'-N-acetyltransferase [Candidatus Saccharimonadales bacterium]
MSFTIRRATSEDKPGWLRLRQKLWPEAPIEYLNFDLDDKLANRDYAVFVAFSAEGHAVAFIETGLRDYGEGCETSPVGYIEAWYVDEQIRGQNLGRELIRNAEHWAREKGCIEMASDTWLDNEASISAHLKLGYEEVERLVHFVKRL